jgi:hypothetical protein
MREFVEAVYVYYVAETAWYLRNVAGGSCAHDRYDLSCN